MRWKCGNYLEGEEQVVVKMAVDEKNFVVAKLQSVQKWDIDCRIWHMGLQKMKKRGSIKVMVI